MYTGIAIPLVAVIAVIQTSCVSANYKSDDPIIFPGPIKGHNTETRYGSVDKKDDDVPEQCRNKNYCTIKPKNYPQEKFDSLIKHKTFKLNDIDISRTKRSADAEGNMTKATNDTKIPLSQPEAEISDLVDKQGDPDDVDNCEVQIEFEPLFKVKTNAGVWRNVVQSPDKNFVQKVRLETCREREAPCFTIFPKMPAYTTFCKQKFTTWHFIVESDDGGEEKIPIDLPTCCSCHYRPT